MKTKKLLSLMLSLALVVGMIPAFGVTASAISGSGTATNPYVVDNFADLKDKLQSNENCFIVVNHFYGTSGYDGCYYLKADNGDYEGNGVAITVPKGTTKHLTINTKMEFLSNEPPALYSFIHINGGNLYVTGTGSLNVTFNADLTRNGVFLLQGNGGSLTLGGSISVRGDTDAADKYGAHDCSGHAVVNESGTVTINNGIYTGRKDTTILTRTEGKTIINGGLFKLEDVDSSDNPDTIWLDTTSGKASCLITGGTFDYANSRYYDYLDEGLSLADYSTNSIVAAKDIDNSKRYYVTGRTHVVTFNPTSGTVNPQKATTGTDGRLSSFPTPTLAGYSFDGWYNGVGDEVDTNTVFTEDTTVYAHYKESDATPHTITVDDGTADKSTAKAGETVAISANEKESFTFTGWTAYTEDVRSVSFADRLSPNTTFIMPDCDVRMMPNYKYSGSVFTDFYVYITPPVPGEHPQAPIVNIDDYSVSAYNWIETTDTGSSSVSRKMTSSDVFKEGVFYQCRVDLLVKDGIVGEAGELKGYVNGSTKTDGMDVMISRNGSFKVKVIGSYNCHSAKANPFVDVSESDYFYEPVLWAVDKGITNGMDKTHFAPGATCTRGQVVTFLWRAAGSPAPSSTTNPFTDVSPSDYYYNAVLWAVGKNITNGTSKTTFGPDEGCTRGQVVTFLHRFENSPKPSSSTNPFVDVSSSEYYYTPVLWAVGKGITNGTDKTHFSPDMTCTRGQIVTFLYRDMD